MNNFQIPANWDRAILDKNGNVIKNIPYDHFVNLHGHSYFSLLDGMPSPQQIVDRTFELGQPASCITDHGVMFSIVDHFLYAKDMNQHAIAGFEAYVVGNHTERSREGENVRQHLLLLAKNKEAYKKISYWCSVGCTDGFYYRPRIDDSVMARTGGEGVIASSACVAGRIPQFIMNGDMQKAEDAAKYYKNFFEEFYLEIQPTLEKTQVNVNLGLLKIAEKLDIPMIATSDYHYQKRSHAKTHEILLAMQSGTTLSNPDRWKFPGDTFFIASRQDMEMMFDCNGHEVFPKDALKLALDNTVEIANKCTFELETDKHYLPNINIPLDNQEFINWHNKTGKSDMNANYLRYLCIKGLKDRGLTDKKYRERLDYELDVINSMGFNDYFLIYYDIMDFCRQSKIPVGPGRGCFTPNSRVRLNSGETKLIDQIMFGDVVVSHDEKPHSVINKFEYDCKEKIVDLSVGHKNIQCTKDHRVYAIKKSDYLNGDRQPQWYQAEELEPGDLIAELDD